MRDCSKRRKSEVASGMHLADQHAMNARCEPLWHILIDWLLKQLMQIYQRNVEGVSSTWSDIGGVLPFAGCLFESWILLLHLTFTAQLL